MPSEPVSSADMSDKISPNRFPVIITSNCFGCFTNCIAQLSAYILDKSICLYFSLCNFIISSLQSIPDSITFAFSTECTIFFLCSAISKPTLPNLTISLVVYTSVFMPSLWPSGNFLIPLGSPK